MVNIINVLSLCLINRGLAIVSEVRGSKMSGLILAFICLIDIKKTITEQGRKYTVKHYNCLMFFK